VVRTGAALGEVEALCDWDVDAGEDAGVDEPDEAPFLLEPGLSATTSTTTITTMAAAAATGAIHFGRLRWPRCTAPGPYHCSAAGMPWPGIGAWPPGCCPPHHEPPPCWPPC
jgi:hypothetical protein